MWGRRKDRRDWGTSFCSLTSFFLTPTFLECPSLVIVCLAGTRINLSRYFIKQQQAQQHGSIVAAVVEVVSSSNNASEQSSAAQNEACDLTLPSTTTSTDPLVNVLQIISIYLFRDLEMRSPVYLFSSNQIGTTSQFGCRRRRRRSSRSRRGSRSQRGQRGRQRQ